MKGDITDFLRTQYNISEPAGKTAHLKDLESKHFIRSKCDPGKAKIFYPPENTDSLPDLLQDVMLWEPFPSDKSDEISEKLRNERITWRQELYHTNFFERTVRNEIINRLLSSPPHLDIIEELFHLDLKTAVESEVEKEALKKIYSRAASISLYLIKHMFVPMLPVDGALQMSQYNALLLDETPPEGDENARLWEEQIAKIRRIFEKTQKKQEYIWEYRFTSLESLSLATVFICLFYEIQIDPPNSEIISFFLDPTVKKIFLKYIPNPFFYADVSKFIFCQVLYGDLRDVHLDPI